MAEKMFDAPPCPVCANDDAIALHEINYTSDGVLESLKIDERPRVALLSCRRCEHRFARPQVAIAALASYYREIGSEFYAIPKGGAAESARDRLVVGAIERWMHGGRILDVGCGRGELLRAFDPLRWERVGIEPSPTVNVEEAALAGVTIARGFLDSVSLPAGSFDAVVAVDVLEHLRDAHAAVCRMRDLVRDEGVLAAVTGDASSIFARIAGARWGYFGSWEHVSFFTTSSVRYLFENAGFTVIEIRRISHDPRASHIPKALLVAAVTAVQNSINRVFDVTCRSEFSRTWRYPLLFDHILVIAKATHEPSPA